MGIATIAVNILTVLGALIVFASSVRMLRERDALCRISAMGPVASLGLPLIITAAYVEELAVQGWDLFVMLRYLLTVGLLLAVAAVGTNVLARAAYQSGVAPSDATDPQDLAVDPGGDPGRTSSDRDPV